VSGFRDRRDGWQECMTLKGDSSLGECQMTYAGFRMPSLRLWWIRSDLAPTIWSPGLTPGGRSPPHRTEARAAPAGQHPGPSCRRLRAMRQGLPALDCPCSGKHVISRCASSEPADFGFLSRRWAACGLTRASPVQAGWPSGTAWPRGRSGRRSACRWAAAPDRSSTAEPTWLAAPSR
jgi:hypothetical protein